MLLITITCVILVSLCSGVGTSLLDWPHHNASLRNDDIPWSSLDELSQLEASRHGLLQAILGDPEVTTNLYCNFAYPYWEGCVVCSIYLR